MKPAIAAWSGIDPTAVGGVLAVTVTAKAWVAVLLLAPAVVFPRRSLAVTVMIVTPAVSAVIVRTLSSTAAVATVLFEDIAE